MAKINIDGNEYEIKDGQTVLQICLENNINVPFFCYHPNLPIDGNCRMCLVEVEGARKPVISCNERAREGMVVRTNTPTVLEDRKSVLEFILINHPLDCPICDQAGECDLQDQYFDHSASPYRFREEKVHKPKAVPLGDMVTLDDERCILCTRCIRFCDHVPKTHEIGIINRGDRSTITTFEGEPMNNAYSINTVDICPVGALTSTDFRFNKRVWFLNQTDSVCAGCATGCNISMDHEGGVVYRYKPRDNYDVNECWMCDEGRLSYKFINSPDRVQTPYFKVPNEGWVRNEDWSTALENVAHMMAQVPPAERGVVLSAQCSNEENFAWYWLAKEVWGTSHIFSTKREPENPSEDNVLRNKDKNPNSRGLADLGVSGTVNAGPRLLFVLDVLNADEIAALQESRPDGGVVLLGTNWGTHSFSARWLPLAEGKKLVAKGGLAETLDELHEQEIASGEVYPWASVVLPLATFAEQSGTFTNAKGMVQNFKQAIKPKGLARTGWQIAASLAACEGKKLPWNSAEEILSAMSEVTSKSGDSRGAKRA